MLVADLARYSGDERALIPASYSTEEELCALIQEGIDDIENGNGANKVGEISGEEMMEFLNNLGK
jgi:hypothetical protein